MEIGREKIKCAISLTMGLRKLVSKKFRVISVNEYGMSKTCNRCMGELSRYKKMDGRLSHSRLCYHNCGSNKKLPSGL